MAAITNQPTNPQFLSPVGFNFNIRKLPNVNYFVQAVNLPGVQLGETPLNTPFHIIPTPGDHITYGEMAVTFKVDEDMENYIELYNWMQYLGFPEGFNQAKQVYEREGLKGLTGLRNVQRTKRSLGEGGVSDASLTVLNPCDAVASGNLDSDGDGVSDICDLDDNNEVMIDTYECSVVMYVD